MAPKKKNHFANSMSKVNVDIIMIVDLVTLESATNSDLLDLKFIMTKAVTTKNANFYIPTHVGTP